jgi:membrane associated rhomboid family serine protease/Zn-finger nucleic acid-binding protein
VGDPQPGSVEPPISAQCPSCGLHELVPVPLGRRADGNWTQLDRPSVFRRVRPVTTTQRVQIDVCPVCMGAWFDHGELDTLSGELEDVSAVLAPEARPSTRPCPHGHGPLVEQRLPGIISTPVDRCRTCHGIWLDGHERRKLAKATTSEGQDTKTERWLKRGAIWAAQVLTQLPVEVDNPARGTPWVVFSLLGLLFAVFLLQVQGTIDTYDWGLVAGRVKHEGDWWTIATYMFLHGSWVHILGNAYFLYTFGDNVEHLFGRTRFVIFFLLAGLVGGAAHFLLTRATALPVVGASGCIAGVLGAYLWAFPRQHLFQVILWVQVKIPAWVYLFVWVAFHILMANFGGEKAVGTAWWAHLGGFLVGLAVTPWVLLLRRREVSERVRVPAVLR